MRLDRREIIGGQPIKLVRKFLRTYRNGRADPEAIAEFFEIKTEHATSIAAISIERGLIEKAAPESWDRRPVVYAVSDLGVRFAAANLLKPIPRAKADQIVTDLMARVETVNARNDLTHFVGEVRAFGSYITISPDVADIDLAISLVPKPPPDSKDLVEWHLERADQSGRLFSSYLDQLCYSEVEVRRLVKDRNQYVSLHSISELENLKIKSRLLYSSPDRPRYDPGRQRTR